MSASPLIVSVQTSEGSAANDPETLLKLAKDSLSQGVKILRLEGVETIRLVRKHTDAVVIGLIKRRFEGSEIYITPTLTEVEELLATGCEGIAFDATNRPRADGSRVEHILNRLKKAGHVAVADCDSAETALTAFREGASFVSTTLVGYTGRSSPSTGPDLQELGRTIHAIQGAVRDTMVRTSEPCTRYWSCEVIAEGRFVEKCHVEAALRAGASAVVVGGAINDAIKNTRRLMPSATPLRSVGAIDIGGTWQRFAKIAPWEFRVGELSDEQRIRLPKTRQARLDRIKRFLSDCKCERVGISTGGVVRDNLVAESKPSVPQNVGTDFNELLDSLTGDNRKVVALNDGLACAWGHACHPDFAGKNVATLAIGTGVGFGFVREGKLFAGPGGEYSRLNDLPAVDGKTYEELLGGAALSPHPTEQQRAAANAAVQHAIRTISTLLFPDVIVVCGTVGMQRWLKLKGPKQKGIPAIPVERSPFGPNAGLFGAAALALWPPELTYSP